MAPLRSPEAPSNPLADFFWIAGLDSADILSSLQKPATDDGLNGAQAAAETIQEDADEEQEDNDPDRSSKRFSYQRMSKLSYDGRTSVLSIRHDPQNPGTASNRSSATIRAVPTSSVASQLLNDVDFDKALRAFASDRDSFLSDLNLNPEPASTNNATNRPRPRPKTQKITSEESNALKSSIGSVRRHMSFRDMSSVKRQPSLARQASTRTSKRLSNYNSVIPAPQPIDTSSNMHPLKRRFEPVLLDRYPQKDMSDEAKRRGTFPDYVPMFAFPNDINVVSSDSRPRSTWHGFVMTTGEGSKLYAICVTVWIPLNAHAAEQLEKKCEEWRRSNMTDEERELAASLGERLANERANLSRLLAKLPAIPSGSSERENLEDEISAVEEKIGLMTDLLRPVRHGAASKIEGLTDGDSSGFWIPRAYGILGRDGAMTSFWKEWLRSIIVPMQDGTVLRVPPSSPRVGTWQPLEQYVVNLCTEAFSPITSKTQVELAIRDLRLFARREAINELPGSRNTDLYALFRALSIPNIIILLEYVLSESRIILLSSHTAMLHLASKALAELLFPMQWVGVFIPVLPARLIQALEAPCPYIVGILRQYEKVELPEDDFVLVDLDQDEIESTARPTPLPRQQRRKLMSLLQAAASHHYRFGVRPGPPVYAMDTFPYDAFSSENPQIFSSMARSTSLAKLVSWNSNSFGAPAAANNPPQPQVYNAFLQANSSPQRAVSRPSTSSTSRRSGPPSPRLSPVSGHFPPLPLTPVSRNDSGFALQTSLREKRSGHFDAASRRSSSMGLDRQTGRRPSVPLGHSSSLSTTTLGPDFQARSTYAPSTYAQSTLAASTVMPQVYYQPVHNGAGTCFAEGHCLQWVARDDKSSCTICDEKAEDGIYKCTGCNISVHNRCTEQVHIPCPVAFHPEQVRAAFVRCFASLFYTYRKHLLPPTSDQKKSGMLYRFDMDGFIRSLPHENGEYIALLRETQAFNEFIHERETTRSLTTPKTEREISVALFDQIILSKRNRGKSSFFSGRASTDFLSDTSDHLWRSASTSVQSAQRGNQQLPGDWKSIVTRVPAKLDPSLMKEPRMIQGVPRISKTANNARRKPLPAMMNGLAMSPPR